MDNTVEETYNLIVDNINNPLISDSEIHNVDRLVRNNSGTKVMGEIVATLYADPRYVW